jgi:hypothetical protein
MTKIALISATFGGVDEVKLLPQHDGIMSVIHTGIDELKAASSKALKSWNYVVAKQLEASGMLEAKNIKMNLMKLQPTFDYYVWADGSVKFDDMRFIPECCDGAEATFIRHPDRATVMDEYVHCCSEIAKGNQYLSQRYSIEQMSRMMDFLESYGKGYEHGKLWCGTVFVVKNDPWVKKAMATWWKCIERFGVQDQLSLAYAFADSGVHIRDMGIDLRNNPFFHLENHIE